MSIEKREIIFERGEILNVRMLEELQESAKDYLRIKYFSYCDGIIAGFNFFYNHDQNLALTPGILKYNEELYLSRSSIIVQDNERFNRERREGDLFIYLLPQESKIESNIEIKELKLEITEKPLANKLYMGSFVDRVHYRPEVEYEKLENLNNKVYINILDRVYATKDGEAMTPWIGKKLFEHFIEKTTLSPIETYFFNSGVENKPILKKIILKYLDNIDAHNFSSSEILSEIIKKINKSASIEKKEERIVKEQKELTF